MLLIQRDSGVPVVRTLLRAKLAFAAHLVAGAAGAFYLTQGEAWRTAGLLLIGFAAGSYIRIVRSTIASSRFWPVVSQIIDWNKAEALLKEENSEPAPVGR